MKNFKASRHTAVALGVASLCAFSAPAAMAVISPLSTDAVFASTSFWYKPIPAQVTLHANSANFVKEFLRQKQTYYGNVTINTWNYASPVYTVGTTVPTVPVKQWDCQHKGYLDKNLATQWAQVPIPSYARPSSGTDAEFTIYQPGTNTLWEFWRGGKDAYGKWTACWGGRMQSVKASPGIWAGGYGTTATGLPFLGGQITAEELARGEIRHAIGISLVDVERSAIFSWPAARSDGYNPTRILNRIPEGLRFRLDPTVNVSALPMTTAGKIIARAAQVYGFVVWDKSGAIALRTQNPLSYTSVGKENPYPALFGGKPNYAVLDGFPWSRLQFLPMNYGKP